MIRNWMARHGWAPVVGLGLTAVALLLHLAGLTERFELLVFDLHVRHFSRIAASDRIVHIDITDDALDRVESWPWPRDLQAELIRILHELGAERIAMDIVWTEPKRAEVRDPTLNRYADVEGSVEHVGELTAENVVFPDDELARAIHDAGNVYLALYYAPPRQAEVETDLRARVAKALRERFESDAPAIAARLGARVEDVQAVLPGIKRRVAEEQVVSLLDAKPDATAAQIHASMLSTPFERETADRADVLAAYYRALGLRALRNACAEVPAALRGELLRAGRVTPPLYKLTAGAPGLGFVTFEPDFDGRTRHIPLLLDWDGHLVEQLAVAVARDVLDIGVDDISLDGYGLRIAGRGNRRPMRIQLDSEGQMLINWHVEPRGWQHCFRHVPVTALLRISDCRRTVADNRKRMQLAIAEAMRLVKDDAAFTAYRDQVNRAIEQRRLARWAALQGRGDSPEAQAAHAEAERLDRETERDEQETIAFIREQWEQLKAEHDPSDPQIADDYRRFREANARVTAGVAELEAVNAAAEAEQRRLMDELRPLVANRICFVGYTATAVADMVTTPAYPRMPGVLVHSNVLNAFLQAQFLTWTPRWGQAAIIAAFGVFITVFATTRGPRSTFVLLLIIILVAYGLSLMGAFQRLDHWVRLLTAMVSTFVIWAVIVLLRFLITDRQKRQFSKAVSQYVSPAVARQIAGSATTLDLAPASRVVSCFFSDLAGFTRMSERLGPDGTRTVLNPYLEVMSEVLHRHQALINKFIGDGIFAFFNPPILPCPQHERAVCEAAIDSQRVLRELAARNASHPMADEFARLRMRIGIASGPVFVGDYGSENKLDYTCMGDTVNLAARLEAANKAFGTNILVSGGTRAAIGDAFVCRPLGMLQVVGQTVAVPVFELVGRAGEVNGDVLTFARAFEEAVVAFAARDWARSRKVFARCLALRPGEAGASRYLAILDRIDAAPPGPEWTPAIELTEK